MPSEKQKPGKSLPPAPEARAASTGDGFRWELRGFGPVGILASLIILLAGNVLLGGVMLPVGGLLAVLWTRLSQTPWHEIGYVRPKSWIGAVVIGFTLGVAFKFTMKAVVMPLLGADPINHAYHYLAGNRAALPGAVWTMFAAGFGEETVFRGYLFERLGKLFGPGVGARTSIVLLTSGLFGAAHYFGQGVAGAEQAAIVGLVLGTIFCRGGSLFMLMCAHTAFDLTALAMIYWNLETRVAHLLFR